MKNIIHAQDSSTYCRKAIGPPPAICKPLNKSLAVIYSSMSSLVGSSQIQNESSYDTQSDFIETETGSRSSYGGSDFNPSGKRRSDATADEHNNSFRNNGTDMDFNPEMEHLNNEYPNCYDNLTLKPFLDNISLKTRRSNSLTIAENRHNEPFLMTALLHSSNENLSYVMQKYRSYSISSENPRLTASGSDTRINDVKSTYQTFQSQHPGMRYVGAWLKKLRLHKYSYLFENYTFEEMMNITNEYLERHGITKGARDKLVNSIQKLKERYIKMLQTEQDLNNGKILINAAIEILSDVVTTPIKPLETYNTCDVASQFLSLLMLGECFIDASFDFKKRKPFFIFL